MAVYNPPTENLPIFDNSNFVITDTILTREELDASYLRFPEAQGEETLMAINVGGLATFSDNVIIEEEIEFDDGTVQNSAFTGAGALAGSYTSSDITIDSDGKITAISNGSGGGGSFLEFPNAQGEENLLAINVDGLATFMQGVIIDEDIEFNDGTVQESAYTGAGSMAGSYTSSDITIDSDGKITAISNGSGGGGGGVPPNVSVNSLTTAPNPNPSALSTCGINNQYNRNGFYSRYNGSVSAYGSYWTPSTPINILFRTNSGAGLPVMNGFMTIRLNCFFYNPGASNEFGQTTCYINLFPSALDSGSWGSFGSESYNINNYINGSNSFTYTNPTYAPTGRQYWSYAQQFTGAQNANGWLRGSSPGAGQYLVNIDLIFGWVSIYCIDVQILNASAMTTNNCSVQVYF